MGAAAPLIALVNEITGNRGQFSASAVWKGGLGSALRRVITTGPGRRLGLSPRSGDSVWPAGMGQHHGVQGGPGGVEHPGMATGSIRDARMSQEFQDGHGEHLGMVAVSIGDGHGDAEHAGMAMGTILGWPQGTCRDGHGEHPGMPGCSKHPGDGYGYAEHPEMFMGSMPGWPWGASWCCGLTLIDNRDHAAVHSLHPPTPPVR